MLYRPPPSSYSKKNLQEIQSIWCDIVYSIANEPTLTAEQKNAKVHQKEKTTRSEKEQKDLIKNFIILVTKS